MANIERRIARAEQRARLSGECSLRVLFRPAEDEAGSAFKRFEQEYEAALNAGKQVMVVAFANSTSQHEPI
jgi:hypothetical protein